LMFIKAAQASEIGPGQMKMAKAGSREVLIANVDGRYYAISHMCTHAGGSLSEGTLRGSFVTCPNHGCVFDVTNGRAVQGPQIAFAKFKARNELTYRVKLEGGDILVGID